MTPWRPWNGRGTRPRDLPYNTFVQVRRRDGTEDRSRVEIPSRVWEHSGGDSDIMFYRPCPRLHEAPVGLRRMA
jgi:hypothetical protein